VPLRIIALRQLTQIVVMFMIVQFAGLFLVTQVFSGLTYSAIESSQEISSMSSVLFYIAYIIIFAVVLLLVMRVYRGEKFFIAFEGTIIFVASFFVFLVLVGIVMNYVAPNLPQGATISLVSAGVLSLTLVIAKNKRPNLRNFAAMVSSVGVGFVLGMSFSFPTALLFVVALAVYDFIAVFITKHMMKLANIVVEKNLALMVGVNEIEAVPRPTLNEKELGEYLRMRRKTKTHTRLLRILESRDLVPIGASAALGTGDLATPLMLAVSAYSVRLNFMLSLFIICGAVLGLVMTMLILKRYKRGLPAIPPLLLGMLAAIGAYSLIFRGL
jgi:presenilin-like A22 family membrane protease